MDLYRCAKCNYITDLSGYGAFKYGGRWNSPGTYMLYTASHASLALLESLVHMSPLLPSSDYCMMKLMVESDSVQTVTEDLLITDWQKSPATWALRRIGDQFIHESTYLLLKVPSAILPTEWNYLINPRHALAPSIIPASPIKLMVDQRLKS